MDFGGRVAVVTGGASGIGAACASALRAAGAQVVVWDQSANADVVCDVADADAVDAAIGATRELAGDPTILVAAAGILRMSNLLDLEPAEWDRVLAVNARGVMLCLRAVARCAVDGGTGGSLVAISSINGTVADVGLGAYGAAKAAVNQLVRVSARELGPYGVRVNAIGPGTTDTPMAGGVFDDPTYRADVIARTPLGQLGKSEWIADATVNLIRSDWVTGQILLVDGGSSLVSARQPR